MITKVLLCDICQEDISVEQRATCQFIDDDHETTICLPCWASIFKPRIVNQIRRNSLDRRYNDKIRRLDNYQKELETKEV
jgi:hypothetical protein